MKKVSEAMLKRRILIVAADLQMAGNYLGNVLNEGVCYQSSSCNVLQTLRNATAHAEKMHAVAMRIWDEDHRRRA